MLTDALGSGTRPGWLASVHHDGSTRYVDQLYPRLGETVRLRLRLAVTAPVQRIWLRTFPDGEQALTPLTPAATLGPARWWEGQLRVHEPLTHYRFVLDSQDGLWWYSAAGLTPWDPLDHSDFRLIANYDPPTWVQRTVFYQIFPDRFANGHRSGDPQPHTYPWGAAPPAGQPGHLIFYGGDLPGLQQRLDYLTDLGVDALYLTPIFTAYSNHKYDVVDYTQVDPHFGGNAALAALRRALTGQGLRYLLDITPNHCGYGHPWFQRAQADAAAPEAAFFTFHQHPHHYESWLGVASLPKLNYRSPALRQAMYAGPDAVFQRWLRPPYQADGWRVDVANMLGRQGEIQLGVEVARGIRQAVKATRADAYLMGENFFDASPQLQGDQWDGVMNYAGFSQPLLNWLGGYELHAWGWPERVTGRTPWPTAALLATWRDRLAAIPWAVALQQYNVLGSHDTHRCRSRLGGNDALHRLAVTVQMTFPGAPGLYYGDEIGLLDDPALQSRGCMVWDKAAWDHDLHAFYCAWIETRRRDTVLHQGGLQFLLTEADTLAYQREDASGWLIVVAHRSAAPRPAGPLAVAQGGIPDGVTFVERFSGRRASVVSGQLPLPTLHQGSAVWRSLDAP